MDKYSIKKRIAFYEKNKIAIDTNSHNYIPFYGFNRLNKYVPGIIPGIMYKVTSHMGVGKTQISKYLFVYQPILYALQHNLDFKVIYLALEESKEEFIDGFFIHILRRKYKLQLNRFSLTGFSNDSLTSDEMKAVKGAEAIVAKLLEHVEVIDYAYTPTKLFNVCKKFAKKWGNLVEDEEGEIVSYTPNNPKQIVLVINDHISLLEGEFEEKSKKFLDDRRTIAKWHTHYARRILAKQWNWAILNVQQQSLESEKQQFTSKGDSIINKIIPSLDGLANNKEVGRDDYVVFGLFAPERYGLETFRDYNITKNAPHAYGDRFRTLHLLKNRFGPPNKVLPLYFDGRYNYFKEMPLVTDPAINYFNNLLTK